MTDKPSWLFKQSGVIPYRRSGDSIEILIITSRKRKRWVIPKGVIEPGLTPIQSAAAEAFEEAGLRGNIDPKAVGEYDYNKWGGTCHVRVFLMEVIDVLDTWPEDSIRSRRWTTVDEAAASVRENALKAMILDVPSYICNDIS